MNNKRLTSYGLYVYRVQPESKACPHKWDLHSTVINRDAALMQGKMLSLQPDVTRVEILRQQCDPKDGLCNSKVIKIFNRRLPLWQKPAIWISSVFSGATALALFLSFI